MKLSVVIPAYNEENGIGPTLDSIPTKALELIGYQVEKLVVNNDSNDNTAEIAARHGARVINQPKRGYGHAYKAGFEHATGDIIATGDADMTYPFDALPRLLCNMNEHNLDFITTDRLSELLPGSMNHLHIFGNKVLTIVMRLLFRTPFHDSQSGMWLFRKAIWDSLDVRHNGMPFSQEIKVEAHIKGFRCAEYPIEYRKRVGKVKLSFNDAWRNMSELIKKRVIVKNRAAV